MMVPAVPEAAIAFPAASDATTLLTATGTLALVLPAAMLTLAVAIEPPAIGFVVLSNITHVVEPAEILEHETPLAPPPTVMPVTLGPYVIVHCRLAGCAPPAAPRDRGTDAAAPAAAFPDPSDNVTC